MAVSFDRRLIKPDDVLFQEFDGESVLLHATRCEYFGLNESGHRMWVALTESDSIQQAYETLLAEFDVDSDRLRQDLNELIEALVESDLARVA